MRRTKSQIIRVNLPWGGRVWTLSGILVIATIFMWIVPERMLSGTFPIGLEQKKLGSFDAKAVDLIVEKNKLLISLASIQVAAIAYMIYKRQGTRTAQDFVQLTLFCVSFFLASFSIYYGVLIYGGLIKLMESHLFVSDAELVLRPQAIQFYSLHASALCFVFALIIENRRKGNENF
jgi:hypothetical protein